MDFKQLKKVIKIFESSSLSELEIEEGKTRFRLTKGRKEKGAIAEKRSVSIIEDTSRMYSIQLYFQQRLKKGTSLPLPKQTSPFQDPESP